MKFPSKDKSVLKGYGLIWLAALVLCGLSIALPHDSSKMSCVALAFECMFIAQLWLELCARGGKLRLLEWVFVAIWLLPVPVFTFALLFLQLDGVAAQRLMLFMFTPVLAYLVPSPKNVEPQTPAWQKHRS